jgi:hypothetical protein
MIEQACFRAANEKNPDSYVEFTTFDHWIFENQWILDVFLGKPVLVFHDRVIVLV